MPSHPSSSLAVSLHPPPLMTPTMRKRHVKSHCSAHREPDSPPLQRPVHLYHRRASQPASVSHATRRRQDFSSPIFTHAYREEWSSSGSNTDSGRDSQINGTDDEVSSDEDGNLSTWASKGRTPRQDRLAYLDLSLSIPYTVVAMRDRMIIYLAALEDKARDVASRLRMHEENNGPDGTGPTSSSSSQDILLRFQSQLSVIHSDLKRIALLFPTPSQAALGQRLASFPSPVSTLTASQAALTARSQSLSADWASFASALSARLPAGPSNLIAATHAHFDLLHETVTTMSLRDFWEEWGQIQWPSTSLGEVSSSLMDSIKESTAKGRERASTLVDSMLELERAAYARACELSQGGRALITYNQLPHTWKNNEHILTGYRFIPLNEPLALLKSTMTMHNETLNIHTHLVGIAFVVPLFWASHDPNATAMDKIIRAAYLGSALKCLVLSVAWHVCSGSSDLGLFTRSACADYSGVAVLIAATVVSTVYAEFFCQPNLALLYTVTTGTVGLAGAVLPWQTWFNKRQNKGLRIAMFLGICLTSLLPLFHACYEHGLVRTVVFLSPLFPSLLTYIAGLIVYACNWPECLLPGRFDLWGHSHQWWHCAILVAIVLHWKAMAAFREGRVEYSCHP